MTVSNQSNTSVDELTSRLRLDEEERSDTSSAELPEHTTTQPNREAKRSTGRGMAKFRDMEQTSVLMLFTPVLVPSSLRAYYSNVDEKVDAKPLASSSSSSSTEDSLRQIDPFETLGVAFSKYRRVRHVPYIPHVGFTKTHDAFAAQADAIVVVTCEPEKPPASLPGNVKWAELKVVTMFKQIEFATALASAIDEGERDVPKIRLHFSEDRYHHEIEDYKNVRVEEKYGPDAVKKAVQRLFKGGK